MAVITQDHQAELKFKSTVFTLLQFKSALFYSWRHQAKVLKRRRIGTLIRTWNALIKNVQRNKLIRVATFEVVKLADRQRNDLVQLMFDELKLHKERNKLALHSQTRIETNEAITNVTEKNRSL